MDNLSLKIGIDERFCHKTIDNAAARWNAQSAHKHQLKLGVDSKGMGRALGQITGNVKDFESSLAASNARVIAFGASTAIIGGVIRSFQELANATIEVEKSMIDVNRVFGLTSSGLQKLTSDLFEVSKATASSFKDSSKALLEFSRQGVSAADALQRTKDALTLTRLAGVSTEAAVESLTATVNGFSNAGLTTTQVLNKLVAVEQNYAVGAGDLAEALARTGQAAQEAGVDLDQLNALVTSAQQNTARGGAVIGNALKTIFTRVQRAGTLEQLENFNVVVRDLEGNVLPAVQILRNFASVYKDLGTSQKSQLSEQIAGVYQVNILKALIKDLNSETSIYDTALRTGADATNEAEIATAKLNSTMSALLSRVGTGTTQLMSNIGNVTFEPLARSATTAVETILNVFNTALEGDGVGNFFANGFLKGMRNVLGGPVALGLSAVLYKVASTSFTYLSEVIPKLIGITTETSKRRLLEENVLAIMQQQGNVANAILGAQGNQAAQVAIIVNEARLLTQEYQKQVALSKQLAPLLSQQGLSVGKRGIETTRSGGFIPDSVRNAEIQGAFQGGYIPGKVIKSPVGGVMNSAEHVKYYAGFSQPFINPPANSKAGMAHKVNSIRKTGVNPYSSDGFLPNFARYQFNRGKNTESYLSFELDKLNKKIIEPDIFSGQKGDARTNYSFLADFAKRKKLSIASGFFNPQPVSLNSGLSGYELFEKIYPQFRYRKGLVSSTSGGYNIGSIKAGEKPKNQFKDLDDLRSQVSKLSEREIRSIVFGEVNDTFSSGFIPNFAYKNSVMGLEQKISGEKAIYSDNPFPHVRNSSQPTFNSAIADHGGLNNALKDSILGQKSFGLLNSGFVPNFAGGGVPSSVDLFGLNLKSREGKAVNVSELSTALTDYVKSLDLVITGNLKLNPALQKIIGQYKLHADDFQLVRLAAIEYANKERSAALILDKLNKANSQVLSATTQGFGIVGGPVRPISPAEELARRTSDISSYAINPNVDVKEKLHQQDKDISKANVVIFKQKQEEIKQRIGVEQAREVGERMALQQEIEEQKRSRQETTVSKKVLASEIVKEKISREEVRQRIELKNRQAEAEAKSSASKSISIYPNDESFLIRGEQERITRRQRNFQASLSQKVAEDAAITEQRTAQARLPKIKVDPNFAKNSFAFDTGRNFLKQLEQDVDGLFADFEGIAHSGPQSFSTISGTSKHKQFNSSLPQGTFSGAVGHQFFGESNLKGAAATSPINKTAIVETFASGFYSPDVSIALQKEIEKGAKANKKTILEKINSPGLGLGLALGAPLLGGFVEQAAFGNKRRSELSETERGFKSVAGFGVSSIATGALVGSSFGSVGGIPGVALGAGAGALLALVTAVNDTSLSFEELVQKADEVKAKNAEIVSSGQAYINLLNQRNQLTDPEKINIASLNLVDAFYEIKDVKLQDAFRDAKEDVTGLTKALGDYDKKARLNTKREEQIVKIASLSKIAGSEKDIRALGFKKSVITEKDRRSGQRPDFLSGQDPRNIGAAQAQVKTLLDDLSSVSDEVAFYLQRQLDFTEQFDADKISSLLNSQGVSDEDTIEVITKQMSGIFSGQGPISEFIRKNFAKILIDFKGKAKAADSSGESVIFAQNTFNQFKLRLNKSIFDELEQVNQAAKTFEFDQSIQTMVTEKMREIGDGMFSALLNNASELGQLSIKQSQLQFNSKIQSKQIEESLAKVQGETAGKRSIAEAKLQSDLVALIPQTISKSGAGIDQISTLLGQAKTGNLTDKNIQSSLNDMFNLPKDNFDYPSFGDSFVGIENQTQDLFLKFKSANNEFQGVVTALEREVEIEKVKANYARSINELSFKTAEQQLNTEKKRLAISIAQKEAINRLSAESGAKKISGTTALELEKIKQGGEFRYLGMNKKEEFVAQQADQQRIFQLEQSLEKDKILAETRQSIIEIAAQNANTEALNENTLANLEATKTFLELKIKNPSISEIEKGSYRSSLEQNISNTKSFQTRTKINKFDLFSKGQNEYSSVEQAIASLKDQISDSKIDPSTKTALESELILLEQKAKQMESSATIVAAKSKQVADDFQRSTGFVNNMGIGFSQLSRSADDIVDKLGRDVPAMFADGMASAITQAITGAKNIGDALKDAAISFGQQIISDLLRASLYKTLGATGIDSLLSMKQKGGVITAQNGMYISGGRTGDKNMALLEDGEYVLNRNAVKAAGGKGVLDQFNFKQAPRFATGGGFGTQAEMKYLRPKGKDEGYDFTDALLSGNSSQAINADNYSAYAYENDQYFVKKREQAVQDLAEKVQRDFTNKQKNVALITSIIGAVGSVALASGIGKIGSQVAIGKQIKAADGFGLTATSAQAEGMLSGSSNRALGEFALKNPRAFQLNGVDFSSLKGTGSSVLGYGASTGVGLLRRGRQDGGLIGLNGGGYLPHGSRLGDTIPALLTGGEYVMNNSAVKKYGIGKMNEMNNGSMNENSSSTTSNTNNNSANISISIDRSGKSVVGATNSSYEKQDLILTKDMARSIHAVVLKTMSNEKRYGGELYKNPLRS